MSSRKSSISSAMTMIIEPLWCAALVRDTYGRRRIDRCMHEWLTEHLRRGHGPQPVRLCTLPMGTRSADHEKSAQTIWLDCRVLAPTSHQRCTAPHACGMRTRRQEPLEPFSFVPCFGTVT